jgi:hypothetical protein
VRHPQVEHTLSITPYWWSHLECIFIYIRVQYATSCSDIL